MINVKPNPSKSVLNLSTMDKVIGKLIDVKVLEEPKDEQSKDLVGDAFYGLYKQSPTLTDTPPEGRDVNHAVLKYALSGDEFERLHPQTAGNLPASMTTTPLYYQALMADDTIKNALDAQQKAEEEQKKAEEAQKAAEQARQKADQNPEDQEQQAEAESLEQQAEQAGKTAQSYAQRAQKATEKIGNTPMSKAAFKSAANQAQKKAEEVNGFMQSWGIDPSSLEYDEAREVVDTSANASAAQLAEVLGRLKGIATRTLKANKRTPEGAAAEVALTKDPSRLFLEELAGLNARNPRLLRAEKIRRLTTTGLLGWVPLETPKKSGTFRVYVDRSGSMSGDPIRVACSLAIGIAQATREENDARRYTLRLFDYHLHEEEINEESSWQQHLKFAQTRAGGGTHYGEVLDDIIESMEASMNDEEGGSADALVITDGQADTLSDELAERLVVAKEATGSRLFYVEIGTYQSLDDRDPRSLSKMSDVAAAFHDSDGFLAGVDKLAEDICQQLAENV